MSSGSGSGPSSHKRAVLVFFESISRLEDFYAFIRANPLGYEVAIITETTSELDKEGNLILPQQSTLEESLC
jgi:hypothetical protein